MSLEKPRWIALALAVIGAAIGELLSHPAGIAITFAGVFLAFGQIPRLNVLTTRLILITASLLHGLVLWRAFGNPLLAAAPVAGGALFAPPARSIRTIGYHVMWIYGLSPVAELIVALFSGPFTLAHLWLLPTLFSFGFIGSRIVHGMFDIMSKERLRTLSLGKPFPEFALPARLGKPEFRLSDHRGQYVLICFLRGDWCPVCHVILRMIAKDAAFLAERGVKVVAIGADSGSGADDVARILDLDYTILIDPECSVAAKIGIVHPNAFSRGKNTNLPALFLVDPEGKTIYVSNARDLTLADPRAALKMIPA